MWAGYVGQCVPVLYASVCTGVPAYVYRCCYYISCFINYPFLLVGASPDSPLQSSIHHSLESLLSPWRSRGQSSLPPHHVKLLSHSSSLRSLLKLPSPPLRRQEPCAKSCGRVLTSSENLRLIHEKEEKKEERKRIREERKEMKEEQKRQREEQKQRKEEEKRQKEVQKEQKREEQKRQREEKKQQKEEQKRRKEEQRREQKSLREEGKQLKGSARGRTAGLRPQVASGEHTMNF